MMRQQVQPKQVMNHVLEVVVIVVVVVVVVVVLAVVVVSDEVNERTRTREHFAPLLLKNDQFLTKFC